MQPNQSHKRLVFVLRYLNYLKNWIDPLYPYLKKLGYEVHVFHINSLSYNLSIELGDYNPEYHLYDVKLMGVKGACEQLKSINPDGLIFLSFKSLFEILMRCMAMDLGIKSIYYQHGIFGAGTFQFYMANLRSSIMRHLHLFPMTANFILRLKKRRIWYLRNILNALLRNAYHAIRFDAFVLYSQKSFDVLKGAFVQTEDMVSYSGFPIVGTEKELANVMKGRGETANTREVLYLAQSIRQAGLTNLSLDDETDYIMRMAKIFGDHNYTLIIKIHPRESLREYRKRFQDTNILVERDVSLNDLTSQVTMVVGHYSTALYNAVLLRKPIIIYYYPGLKRKYRMFDEIGYVVDDETKLDLLLTNNEELGIDKQKYSQFIEYEIGKNNSYEHLSYALQNSLNN